MCLAAVLLGLSCLVRLEVQSRFLLRSSLAIRDQPILDGSCDAHKGLVNIDVILCRAFPEGNAKFFGELFAFRCAHHFFVQHVALVPN